ncbi:MAG: glycosyltransferase [Pseudomonadota bacterium]
MMHPDSIRFRQGQAFLPCRTVSVVIPTLNEEKTILACLKAVLSAPEVIEVVVVDGGSCDATLDVARRAGARCLCVDTPVDSGGGRGGQIRAGLALATGDVVAVVHADACVPSRIFRAMIRALNTGRSVIGGAVGCRFDTSGYDRATRIRCRVIDVLNHIRVLVSGISFGDQVQFFRREPVIRYGVFPAIPLMEDVELALRLRSLGRQVYLNGKVLVSPRRWQRKGAANAFLVAGLFFLYLFQRSRNLSDPMFFYRCYYGIPTDARSVEEAH